MSEGVTKLRERVRAARELPPPAMRRALRQAAGVSLAEIAAALGVSRSAVSYWETGQRHPRARYLRAYLEVLETLREAAS